MSARVVEDGERPDTRRGFRPSNSKPSKQGNSVNESNDRDTIRISRPGEFSRPAQGSAFGGLLGGLAAALPANALEPLTPPELKIAKLLDLPTADNPAGDAEQLHVALEIDGTAYYPSFDHEQDVPWSSSFRRFFGRVGPKGSAQVALQAWVDPNRGVALVDLFNARNDGQPVTCRRTDIGVEFTLHPGAGLGLVLGPFPSFESLGKPPVAHDLVYNLKTYAPDLAYTGATGSPRNPFAPKFLETGMMTAQHAALFGAYYSAFQVRRRFQRVPTGARWFETVDGLPSCDDHGFDVRAFHEDQHQKKSGGRLVPGAKFWPREKVPTWSPSYGQQLTSIDTYAPTHGPELGELYALVRRFRDPRAYDQVRRAALSYAAWDWDCSQTTYSLFGDGIGGGGGFDFGNVSRVKGRGIAAMLRFHQCANIVGDIGDIDTSRTLISRYVDRTLELHESGSSVLLSSNPPQPDHLLEPFDCSYFLAVAGWYAGLASIVTGDSAARRLCELVCDMLEEHFWNESTGQFFIDLPSVDGDPARGKAYAPKDLGTGTHRWLAYPFFAAGRTGSPFAQRVLELAAARNQSILDPVAAGML